MSDDINCPQCGIPRQLATGVGYFCANSDCKEDTKEDLFKHKPIWETALEIAESIPDEELAKIVDKDKRISELEAEVADSRSELAEARLRCEEAVEFIERVKATAISYHQDENAVSWECSICGETWETKADEPGAHSEFCPFNDPANLPQAYSHSDELRNEYRKAEMAVIKQVLNALKFYAKHHHLHTTAPNFADEALKALEKEEES